MEPKESWIRSIVRSATFHSPDGIAITYTDENKGYIINRAIMQQDLLESCLEQGATGLFGHKVKNISKPDTNRKRTLLFTDNTPVSAQVVIDCSGPLSRFGMNENLAWRPLDLETAYLAHIDGVKTQTDTVHIYVSEEIAPGGYAWAFPRNEESLNVGIVIGT
ncbi:unnamed protein product, partial [marine sediment metagenome]